MPHLILNWSVLGEEIREDVRMTYGRPDSEINGKLNMKCTGKGKTMKKSTDSQSKIGVSISSKTRVYT